MLTQIEAKNFKCFSEDGIRLDLAPLTILVGPNGAGKSSILEAIGLLAQSAPAPGERYGFKWQGPWLDFGNDGRFAFHRADQGNRLRLALVFSDGQAVDAWQRDRGLFQETSFALNHFGYAVEHCPRTAEWLHEMTLDGSVVARNDTVRVSRPPGGFSHLSRLVYPSQLQHADVVFGPQVEGASILYPGLFAGLPRQDLDNLTAVRIQEFASQLGGLAEYIAGHLRNRVFLVGTERVQRRYDVSQTPLSLAVGRRGENTLAVLSILFSSPEYKAQADRVRQWARAFGLDRLAGGWVGESALRAGYYDGGSEATLRTDYAGFGSQQILPVIAQLFSAPAGSLVMVEEPEISLHPAAQLDALRMFADAVDAGQQILLTTHSQTLLLALSVLGKERGMSPNDVALYHLSRDHGIPSATRLELDTAWYIKGWVPSFSEVESRLMKEWIGSVRDKIREED